MIKIKKTGNTQYGNWASFEFVTDLMIIRGIAKHNLQLEENKVYTNLCLSVNQVNEKIKYEILEKQN